MRADHRVRPHHERVDGGRGRTSRWSARWARVWTTSTWHAATELGIPVANAPGSMRCVPVAEHAMTLTLIMARRPWLWPTGERRLHFQLQGATLGIVGLGNIGQALARRAAAFEMEICAYTRTRGKFKPVGFEVEEVETLDDLLAARRFRGAHPPPHAQRARA